MLFFGANYNFKIKKRKCDLKTWSKQDLPGLRPETCENFKNAQILNFSLYILFFGAKNNLKLKDKKCNLNTWSK
jgi:hypothetical protein